MHSNSPGVTALFQRIENLLAETRNRLDTVQSTVWDGSYDLAAAETPQMISAARDLLVALDEVLLSQGYTRPPIRPGRRRLNHS